MEEPLLSKHDIESQEDLEHKIFLEERKERHKDDLACIGLMLICIFVHIMSQIIY